MKHRSRCAVAVFLVALGGACASLVEEYERGASRSSSSDKSGPADGLREALRVGTDRAVDALGREGGYFDVPRFRIGLPEELAKIGKALRTVGLSEQVDEFELSMNRAASTAAPLAKSVFLDAVRGLTFQDALAILRGTKREATDYFRSKTSTRLTELFRPTIRGQLDAVGATRNFDRLMDRAASLPFVESPPFDLTGYVTDEALDRLFLKLGEEEQRIREDPIARTTELLKRWFKR